MSKRQLIGAFKLNDRDTAPLAYDIPGAVEASGLGRTMVYQAIKSGELPARKNGRRTVILRSELQRFLENLPFMDIKEKAGR